MYICKKCGHRVKKMDGKPYSCVECYTGQLEDFVYYSEDFCVDLYNKYTELILRMNPQSITEWRTLRLEFGKSKGLKPCTVKTLAYYGSVLPGARDSLRKAVIKVLAVTQQSRELIAKNKQEK